MAFFLLAFSDNPYDTADKWLFKENLPVSYRLQIVEFILENSGQKDFTLDSSLRDPYTGGKCNIKNDLKVITHI